jgi:hypothetical protein
MSTCAVAVNSFFSTFLLLTTKCQQVQQRLFIFSNCLEQAKLCQNVLHRLLHFSALFSYYLNYTNMYGSGYFILQHWSLIIYNKSCICCSGYFNFSIGLLLPNISQHVQQRLFHFTVLVSYYLQYVNMCCSVYFILERWSRIT